MWWNNVLKGFACGSSVVHRMVARRGEWRAKSLRGVGGRDVDAGGVMVATFFTTVVCLKVRSFHVPLPTTIKAPFLRFKRVFMVLTMLVLKPGLSAITKILKLLIFSMLGNCVRTVPGMFIDAVVGYLLINVVFRSLGGGTRKSTGGRCNCTILYTTVCNVAGVVMSFV